MWWLNRVGTANPIDDLRRELDRVFDGFGVGALRGLRPQTAAHPALNIWDDEAAIYVEAEVPGVQQSDLEVLADGNELTIKGRNTLPDGGKYAYHRQERAVGEFVRVVTLPVEVNAERVEATLRDGVLHVRMPKAESAKPRRIALKAN